MATKSFSRRKPYQPIVKLPPLSEEQYEGLWSSIAVNGVKVPILIDENKQIIDGWHRKKIAKELGYDCPEMVEPNLTDEDKRLLARSLNLARRQLTTEQKRFVIAQQLEETPRRSNRGLAKQLGVTHPTVASVRQELESGGKIFHVPEVVGEDGKSYKNYWNIRKNGHGDPLDHFPTPPPPIEALLAREAFEGPILEPASGDNSMVAVLRKHGFKVEGKDIKHGDDFLRRKAKIPNVVTNPPYSNGSAEQFVKHAMTIAEKKIAMLLPLYFLEGIQRHEFYRNRQWPVKAIYILSRRVACPEYSQRTPFGSIWVVWDRAYQGSPRIEWVLDSEPTINGRYASKPKPAKPSTRSAAERRKRLTATTLIVGDCQEKLREIRTSSVDLIFADPVYPCISKPDKEYPRLSEADWFDLMKNVVRESKRIVKPSGSAVFLMQPNFDKLGKMRLWLWDFVSWAAREWNLVQDCWAWSIDALPLAAASRKTGLMRQSVKMLVWLGQPDCYRNQDAVLWTPTQATLATYSSERYRGDNRLRYGPSGRAMRHARTAKVGNERGGSTPYNLLPIQSGGDSANRGDHPATTPFDIAEWCCRYLLPKNGVLLDPMCGSGTSLGNPDQ